MEIRHPSPPDRARTATTDELRAGFLLTGPCAPGALRLVYADVDSVALTELA